MGDAHSVINTAIAEISSLRTVLGRSKSKQIRVPDELDLIKATALAWFKNHRKDVEGSLGHDSMVPVDEGYAILLKLSDRHPSRSKCRTLLQTLKKDLSSARIAAVAQIPVAPSRNDLESPPDFSKLVSDRGMQSLLSDRWGECALCISAGASLAATVMMGGLLEGLLLARVNGEKDRNAVFSCGSAPKEKSGAAKPLKAWNLSDFVAVAHELGWISPPARDLGSVLREYRNFIHPEKQFTRGVKFGRDDAAMFWEVAKGICKQLIASAP